MSSLKFVFIFVLAIVSTSGNAKECNRGYQELLKIRDANNVPALASLLLQHGKIQQTAAVGIRKVGDLTPVTKADKFHLGSDTKAMTATLTAIFIDEGKLSWTSTLGELFPEITTMHVDYKDVTVEMLLAHRSGLTEDLPNFNGGLLWKKILDRNLNPTEGRTLLTREMLSQPPTYQPGTKFEYSNQGYAIIGAILEKISGSNWQKLMREKLFEPLSMESCGFGPLGTPNLKNADQPWAHVQTETGLEPVLIDNPETIGPGATVHCNLKDWSKFIALHLNAYNGKPKLLKANSFLKLHTPYPGQDYTYGAWVKSDRQWANGVTFSHDGSNRLNYATVWWAPNRNMAVMATSNVGAPMGQKATNEALVPLLK